MVCHIYLFLNYKDKMIFDMLIFEVIIEIYLTLVINNFLLKIKKSVKIKFFTLNSSINTLPYF